MKEQELKVGFLNYFSKWWVGGITYFKNLFIAMATTESPRMIPFIMPPADENGDCLLPYATIFPDADYPADPENPPTAADYHMDMLSHLNGNQVVEGRDGIAWIADFQHLHLPEMFDDKEIAFRNNSFHTLIAQNRIVCLSSYDAMEDFKKYAPESAYKARCLHFVSIPEPDIYDLSAAEAGKIRSKRNLPERFFYVPNQFWKHKNHIAVLKAISILKQSGISVHVVFSGNTMDARFPHYFEELEAFCRDARIEENIHVLGLIPLREVYFLMRNCVALINPSKFEGWSSSVEEAKSIGKTMILSNLNVHYEQMPPHGFYFPCDDPEWLADLMKRAWQELPSAPDLAMEAEAQRRLPERIREFGRDFQTIVLDALANKTAAETQVQKQTQVTIVTQVRDLVTSGRQQSFIDTLESVASQVDVSVEHIIVDGGSSDATPEFLQPLVEKYHCKLIFEATHGVYEAMNRGLIQAQGKYIAFLNCDAHFTAGDFLKTSVAALEKGNFDFSYAPVQKLGASGRVLDHTHANPDEAGCFVEMPFELASMLVSRQALHHVAGFNDTLQFSGAYDLVLRLILAGKTGIRIPATGVAVEVGDCTQENADALQRECGLIYARHYGKLGCALTPRDGETIYREKHLPKKLAEILRPYCAHTFAAGRPELSPPPEVVKVAEVERLPQISVILPLPHSAHFLEERIDSIVRQKFTDFEVIVPMAALSENNEALLRAWAKKDPRVHLCRGSGNFWNSGIAKARGKYIYFAVSDQSMAPDCLDHMAAALERHPECSICDTRLQLIDQQNRPVENIQANDRYFGQLSYPADREHIRMAPYDFLQAVCGKKVYASLCQLMIRRDLFAATGEFPEDAGLCADYLWSMYATFYASVVYLPEKLALWRVDSNFPDNEWDFNEINCCVQHVLPRLPEGAVKTDACSLATLLDFKSMLLRIKSPISRFKKLVICAKVMKKYPKKSIQLAKLMVKFHCQHQPRSSSNRANNAMIAKRMQKYQHLIREGMLAAYTTRQETLVHNNSNN